MSTTKTFNNIKINSKYQMTAKARGYYDLQSIIVPQLNNPLSFDMKVYDGLNYNIDLTQNSVKAGEINFDNTILPYVENNILKETNYCFGNSGTNYDLPIYDKIYSNISINGDVNIENNIASGFITDSSQKYIKINKYSQEAIIIFKVTTPSDVGTKQYIMYNEDWGRILIQGSYLYSWKIDSQVLHTLIANIQPNTDYWFKHTIDVNKQVSFSYSTDGKTYIETEPYIDTGLNYTPRGIALGNADVNEDIPFLGSIDLNESKIIVDGITYNLTDSSFIPKYTGYTLNGNAKLNLGICSGFDSSSRLYVKNWNLDTSKDNIFAFTTGDSVSGNQLLLKVDETNNALQFFIGNGTLEYNSGSTSEYATETLETNTLYKIKIHRQDEHTYIFSLSKNNGAYSDEKTITSDLFSDAYSNGISVGNYNSYSSPFQGIIDLTEMYNLLTVEIESKLGIFKDYEDTGEEIELNCHSYNNEYVVLSPNDTLENYTYLGKITIPAHNIKW